MTTFLTRIAATDAGRPSRSPGRPAGGWAFTGLAVTSFGGPLALAALYAPASVAGASAGAGLAMAGAPRCWSPAYRRPARSSSPPPWTV